MKNGHLPTDMGKPGSHKGWATGCLIPVRSALLQLIVHCNLCTSSSSQCFDQLRIARSLVRLQTNWQSGRLPYSRFATDLGRQTYEYCAPDAVVRPPLSLLASDSYFVKLYPVHAMTFTVKHFPQKTSC